MFGESSLTDGGYMSKHTAGPWKLLKPEGARHSWGILPSPESSGNIPWIADVVLLSEARREEQEANANLIASAPELLESAKGLLAYLKDADSHTYNHAQCLRDAIAKAEGK